MKLQEKVIIVTGAGRGMGRAAAIALAKNGASVGVVANIEEEVNSVAKEIVSKGYKAIPVVTDVSNERQVKAMVKKINKEFGIVDVLINNAAVNPVGKLADTKTEDWDLCMAVNLRGMFLCAREIIGPMMKRRSGKIIKVSSRAVREGIDNFKEYCTSKYGVIGLTESLAMEMSKYNVYVNAVCPDRVITKMSLSVAPNADRSRWMKPEDLADLYVFLCSDESKSVNGAIIYAYGFGGFGSSVLEK